MQIEKYEMLCPVEKCGAKILMLTCKNKTRLIHADDGANGCNILANLNSQWNSEQQFKRDMENMCGFFEVDDIDNNVAW